MKNCGTRGSERKMYEIVKGKRDLDAVTRALEEKGLKGNALNGMLLADDILLVTESLNDLKVNLDAVTTVLENKGLKISLKKTKFFYYYI